MENSHVPSKSGGTYNKKTREGDFLGVLGGVGFGFSFLVVVVCHSGFFFVSVFSWNLYCKQVLSINIVHVHRREHLLQRKQTAFYRDS